MPVSIPDDTPHNHAVQKFAHHETKFWVLVLVICLFQNWLFPHGVISGIISVVTMAAILFSAYSSIRHDVSMMCLVCIQEMPTDGGKKLRRNDRSLRMFHWWRSLSLKKMILVVTIIPLLSMIALDYVRIPLTPGYLSIGTTLFWIYIIYRSHVFQVHQRLRPWCPYCKDWGWDDPAPVRDPDPTLVKQV